MIQVVDRALTVLEILAGAPQGLLLADVADALQVKSSACANLLKTMLRRGYVEQTRRGGAYRIGPMALGLSLVAGPHACLRRLADPRVRKVADDTGETTQVSVVSGERRLVVAQAEGEQTVRVPLNQPLSDDLHCTATGRVLLAFGPERLRRRICARIAEGDILRPDLGADLPDGLDEIAASGEVLRWMKDIVQAAVAIRHGDEVVAAVGSFIPRYRCSEGRAERQMNALRDAARNIEDGLNAPPGEGIHAHA